MFLAPLISAHIFRLASPLKIRGSAAKQGAGDNRRWTFLLVFISRWLLDIAGRRCLSLVCSAAGLRRQFQFGFPATERTHLPMRPRPQFPMG